MANDLNPRLTPTERFGFELARCREEKGLSQERLAEHVGCSSSLISHIETGKRRPQLDMAKAFDRILALPDPEYFLRLARRIHRAPYGPAWYMSWLEEIEPRATTLRTWNPLLIPGLLQTEAYARAIFMGHFSSSEAEVEEQVAARMQRQRILSRTDPPELHVLVDEWVLKRPIGGPKVMHEQLCHLATMACRRKVIVQIVPYDTPCTDGMLSPFVIAELDDAPTTVNIESAGEGETSAEHRLVSRIWDRYDKLRSEAYRARESLQKIEEAAEQWTRET